MSVAENASPVEPSRPDEREAEGLKAKSYADAAHEAVEGQPESSRSKQPLDQNSNAQVGIAQPKESNPSQPPSEKVASGANGVKRTHAEPESQLNSHTNDAASRKGAKKTSTDSSKAKNAKAEKKSQGTTDAKAEHKESAEQDGAKAAMANMDGEAILETRVEANGSTLTSTRAPKQYFSALAESKKEELPSIDKTIGMEQVEKDELTSGRQAGARWQRSAIRWAPLNVPLQRRLQTLMVVAHTLSIGGMLGLFFFLCGIPILWPILVPYLLYSLFSQASVSGELSHRSEYMRRLPIWSLFASYFPARLHRTQELIPTRKYIFGYHPHGIISHGAFAAFATEALGFAQLFRKWNDPKYMAVSLANEDRIAGITNTLLTLDANFRVPLYRDWALSIGLASVGRESCVNLLSKGGHNGEGMGRAITIVVGGARESLDAKPHSMRLVLNRRKGFIKLAIRTGADLVPVIGFGENDLYEQFQPEHHPYVQRMQLLVKKFMGFTIPLFHARGIFNYDVGLLPYRRPMNIVVGRPIYVEQNAKPTEAEIDALHERYTKELLRIWDTWKDTFAKDRKEELNIIE